MIVQAMFSDWRFARMVQSTADQCEYGKVGRIVERLLRRFRAVGHRPNKNGRAGSLFFVFGTVPRHDNHELVLFLIQFWMPVDYRIIQQTYEIFKKSRTVCPMFL